MKYLFQNQINTLNVYFPSLADPVLLLHHINNEPLSKSQNG